MSREICAVQQPRVLPSFCTFAFGRALNSQDPLQQEPGGEGTHSCANRPASGLKHGDAHMHGENCASIRVLDQNDVLDALPVPSLVNPVPFCPVVTNDELAEIGSDVKEDDEYVVTSVQCSSHGGNPPPAPDIIVVKAASVLVFFTIIIIFIIKITATQPFFALQQASSRQTRSDGLRTLRRTSYLFDRKYLCIVHSMT